MSLFDKLIGVSIPLVPKPIVRRIAAPYIAGETLEEQVATIRDINAQGFMVASAILGEFVTQRSESEEAVAQYETLLATIDELGLDSNIHVKPTHLGLKLDKEFCYQNIKRLVEVAGRYGNHVRIDMEDSPTVDDTLDIYFRLQEEYDNIGCVLQACLRRTRKDVRRLVEVKGSVRICKGIYIEPRDIAYLDFEVIRKNYVWMLEELLRGGCYVGIAGHDEWVIWESFRVIDQLGLDPSQYEFQMLHGVDAQLRKIILDAGHRLRVAVPYGPMWYPYSVRRLRKNPRIARYVLRALFKR